MWAPRWKHDSISNVAVLLGAKGTGTERERGFFSFSHFGKVFVTAQRKAWVFFLLADIVERLSGGSLAELIQLS